MSLDCTLKPMIRGGCKVLGERGIRQGVVSTEVLDASDDGSDWAASVVTTTNMPNLLIFSILAVSSSARAQFIILMYVFPLHRLTSFNQNGAESFFDDEKVYSPGHSRKRPV